MSISTTIIVGIIVLIVIIFVLRGVRIIPQAETWVIERLGKYNRTLESGINIIWHYIIK